MTISRLPIKRGRKCRHVHYSGRRCPNLVFENRFDRCGIHRKTDAWIDQGMKSFTTKCDECRSMKAAFPIRRDVESGKSNTP